MADGALLEGGSGFHLHRRPEDVEAEEKSRASRRLASSAHNTADCAMLLDMLGLTAVDGLHHRPRRFVLTEGVEPDPDVVPVCRPFQWANPFVLGQYYLWVNQSWGHPYSERVEVPDGVEPDGPMLECCSSVEQAVAWHAAWLPRSGLPIAELVGKHVACWCKTTAPCHGDNLLAAAWRLHINRKKTSRA
ncbi:DUF4326 domain-containing protein [Streptomyces sp. ID05-26A]|nr:DUF4326 domain-containing protein [Streptomyces sp. ID05-26A]